MEIDKTLFFMSHQITNNFIVPELGANDLVISKYPWTYRYVIWKREWYPNWNVEYGFNNGKFETGEDVMNVTKDEAIDWCVQHWIENHK